MLDACRQRSWHIALQQEFLNTQGRAHRTEGWRCVLLLVLMWQLQSEPTSKQTRATASCTREMLQDGARLSS